jgi:hypothetical protein
MLDILLILLLTPAKREGISGALPYHFTALLPKGGLLVWPGAYYFYAPPIILGTDVVLT